MASMNPVLRLRRAFRSIGVEEEQADEVAEALTDHSFSRPETELMFQREMARFQEQMAELKQQMAEMRNQILFGVLVLIGVAVTVLSLVIALVD